MPDTLARAPEVRPATGARSVDIGPGLTVLSPLTVTAEVAGFDVTVTVEPDAGRLVATDLTVRRRPDGPRITAERLRDVLIGDLVRAAGRLVESTLDPESGQYRTPDDLDSENTARLVASGPTEETLDVVAYCYRLAMALGDAPVKSIVETFRIPRSTAGRWVTAARARGYLGAAEGPGLAGV